MGPKRKRAGAAQTALPVGQPYRRGSTVSQVIEVRHATPRRNLPSIFRSGLNPTLARGKKKAVWLHTSTQTCWAILHVARRHHTPADEIVVLTLRVRRATVRRTNRKGIWTCEQVIPPEAIFGVNDLAIFAA